MAKPSLKDKNAAALAKTMKQMERWRVKTGDTIEDVMFKTGKLVSINMQKQIARKVDGPVNFTAKQALYFVKEKKGVYAREYRIGIKDAQDLYLSAIIDRKKPTDKLIPVDKKFTDKNGNIKSLSSNLKRGTYVKVVQPTQTILINTKAKKREDRLIAIRKVSKRPHKISWDELAEDAVDQFNQKIKSIL